MCRRFMPVRCTIHASVVSTSFSRSSFVSTPGGAYEPTPEIAAPYAVKRYPFGRVAGTVSFVFTARRPS